MCEKKYQQEIKQKKKGEELKWTTGVNLGWDMNSAHVSIVIYLRLQGTSVQSFVSSSFHILYALLPDHLWAYFFVTENNYSNNKRTTDMVQP